ncbi:MAG: UDP-N-acetylmuramoyl-L-alanyl-D-glutamate--2,6-diaminopimelate ligase [Caldimonas sp.]|uniref:UDP-N-acetylmuramoyl-L-alanyl-D-glutamate--2, 6-diaminopimelate ligase n=1 Tax=Caldimonas sp. TaxID=2838790 RepID=UPI00391A59F2
MGLRVFDTVMAAEAWLREQGCTDLAIDSRRIRGGEAFIAWPGHATDARQHVAAALAAGARACLVERMGVEAFGFDDERIAAVPGLKAATGVLADRWFGLPSSHLDLVAVTGTNGKTSTAWWVAQALAVLDRPCGLIGTLGVGRPGSLTATGLTTPDPVTLHRSLRAFVDQGLKACAIEASSIGLDERRLDGTRIAVAAFTNFTRDHLDYHGGMAAYWEAKAQLFAWPGLRAAVVNLDDPKGADLVARLSGRSVDLWGYGLQAAAGLRARAVGYSGGGLGFDLCEGSQAVPVRTTLIGDYNVHNLLAVAGCLRALGVPLVRAAQALQSLGPVPGRMQRLDEEGVASVVVDYAHTPDALDKVLTALKPFARERGGALWCVFGCGGDRDSSKRPQMGAIAQARADRVIVTSDNPRSEPPMHIIEQIVAGMRPAPTLQAIEDRRLAIATAVAAADPRDVILLAGKGHEDYQDIGGQRLPFSDVDEARAAQQARRARS